MDFSVNQYLVLGDEPLLFHTGMHGLFASVRAAVGEDVATLRWISFGHVEADECGAMNDWLAASPHATVTQGMTGCMVSIADLADRPPVPLQHGEVLDIGEHRLRWIDTPHVPHAWEAGLVYDETSGTLLCGDLFGRIGAFDPMTTGDIVTPAIEEEDQFHASSLAPSTGATLRALAALEPTTLAPMHGPAFSGDCAQALRDLADSFDSRIADALERPAAVGC
jgi:flavorubredoxin